MFKQLGFMTFHSHNFSGGGMPCQDWLEEAVECNAALALLGRTNPSTNGAPNCQESKVKVMKCPTPEVSGFCWETKLLGWFLYYWYPFVTRSWTWRLLDPFSAFTTPPDPSVSRRCSRLRTGSVWHHRLTNALSL